MLLIPTYSLSSNTSINFYSLFNTFIILSIIVSVIVFGIFLALIIKNRDTGNNSEDPADVPTINKIPEERGKARNIIISLTLSSIVLIVLISGTFGVLDDILNPPEENTLDIDVNAFQWGWKFTYPNGHYEIGELIIPVGQPVVLHVVSDDVIHNIGIIEYKIKIDAIPGRTNQIWFEANEPGEFTIQCYELCGIGHAYMKAKLIALDEADFNEWYLNQ